MADRVPEKPGLASNSVSLTGRLRLIFVVMTNRLASPTAATPKAAARDDRPRLEPRSLETPPNFEQLVAEHRQHVSRLCYRLLGWREDIEDVVQEVFLAALRALPGFRGQGQVSNWLVRITVNACRSHVRKRRSWLRLLSTTRAEARPRAGESAARDLMKAEQFERVRQAVHKLPPKYREVVVLRYLEEMAMADIAQVLAITRNAAEVRLNRARKRLKQDLAELLEQ